MSMLSILALLTVIIVVAIGNQAEATTKQSVTSSPVVSVYLLIDNVETLNRYINDLQSVDKVNFNRVIVSFIRPTITSYKSGSLANTGILGYFDNGDGNGEQGFELLKKAVALSKEKSIEAFLSVGGWNYSCNYEVYGSMCGAPPDDEIHYDWFPDPTDLSQVNTASASYKNIILLANDLGVDGLDVDAEEFWHADKYALLWEGNPWSTSIANSIIANGGPTYDNLVKYGTGSSTTSGPALMPKTIDKLAGILHALADQSTATGLKFSSAAPPVGARPITGFVYGDNNPAIYSEGGLWWLGNLKGLWYHLCEKDADIVNRFDSLGLMTYDLCGSGSICEPYGGGPTDLAGQVEAYMKDYSTWMKSPNVTSANLSVDATGKVTFYPAKFAVTPRVQFGFEVNQPAYPQNESGQLQLTDALVDTILAQQKSSGGVIIWQMYSVQNTKGQGTTVNYTIRRSCETFLAGDLRYDCSVAFPSVVV